MDAIKKLLEELMSGMSQVVNTFQENAKALMNQEPAASDAAAASAQKGADEEEEKKKKEEAEKGAAEKAADGGLGTAEQRKNEVNEEEKDVISEAQKSIQGMLANTKETKGAVTLAMKSLESQGNQISQLGQFSKEASLLFKEQNDKIETLRNTVSFLFEANGITENVMKSFQAQADKAAGADLKNVNSGANPVLDNIEEIGAVVAAMKSVQAGKQEPEAGKRTDSILRMSDAQRRLEVQRGIGELAEKNPFRKTV